MMLSSTLIFLVPLIEFKVVSPFLSGMFGHLSGSRDYVGVCVCLPSPCMSNHQIMGGTLT